MTIDRFTRFEFEIALKRICKNHDLSITDGQPENVGKEWRYTLTGAAIHPDVFIVVNSSVNAYTDVADDVAENSIRVWLSDGNGNPLGSKVQKWTTRVPGWGKRLDEQMETVAEMARGIRFCEKCGQLEKVFKVKNGKKKNKGRLFKKCECDNSFQWLDEQPNEPVQQELPISNDQASDDPHCPDCGSVMVLRHRRKDNQPFWGCSTFPKCRGTRPHVTENIKVVLKEQKATKEFEPSKYQQAIFDWVSENQQRTLVVEALAGSGKTTTGVQMLKLVPRDWDVLYIAFNRTIARELARRVPSHVSASTYHSLGYKAIRQNVDGDVKVNTSKVKMLMKQICDYEIHGHLLPIVSKLVSLVKANVTDTEVSTLEEIAEYYGISMNGQQDMVFQITQHVVQMSKEMVHVIDFDDMCWLPIVHDMPMKKYDFIFIDEAQDTNKAQIELALRSAHKDSRIVAVGDRHQSLYGFRGADVSAIPNLIEALEAQTLPLSISYRCPKAIATLVNETFPDIPFEVPQWAKDGVVEDVSYDSFLSSAADGDMALCRTNAPLVRPAFALIRHGVKAVIRGRDIGKGLVAMIDKQTEPGMSLGILISKLADYREQEVERLLMAKKTRQAQAMEDKVDTIIAISEGCQTIWEVKERILDVFSDEREGVVFSTVHRAKGLEAERVFVLEPGLMPHPRAESEWELEQERNVQYVCYTRAQEALFFVN